jgi:hypothetical protein
MSANSAIGGSSPYGLCAAPPPPLRHPALRPEQAAEYLELEVNRLADVNLGTRGENEKRAY